MILSLLTFPIQQPVAIFLLVMLIILLAPMVFTRLKIPTIVGMILAGMAVGPNGFNLLAHDASFEIFGQVGILYLMFLAGVEIDMYHLRKNLRSGLGFGLITFALPMAIGIFASRWLLHTGWSTAVLLSTMYASHTLLTYPIVNRFGLTNTRSAVISVCGTIVAVFLALLALAEVVDIHQQGTFRWLNCAALVVETGVLSAIIGIVYPRATRWFFRRYNYSVTQFIYIMVMMLVASLTFKLVGLEGILGAFYAGIVLNRFVPVRSALMSRTIFVGNAIFIPYFLLAVGMLIDIRVVSTLNVIYIGLVMTAIALLGKWGASYIGQKIFRMEGVDRDIMFGLTAGKAAATIAATMVGYQYGLINEELMNGAVLMILLCCAVASVITERSAMKLRLLITSSHLRDDGTDGSRQDARQLIAVSNPVTAQEIMNLAILMRHPANKRAITTLFVRNTDDARTVDSGRRALSIALATAIACDLKVTDVERFDINIVAGMVNVMKERDCTDLIIGMHRRSNIVDTFYGNVIEQLLSTTNRMVIMSRCFIPVDTIRRMVVTVPTKAEYETGFRRWVERVGNLATQLSSTVVFIANPDTARYIKGVLAAGDYHIDTEYRDLLSWDDFITGCADLEYDDLMVIIGARRMSLSFSTDLENLPEFLSRYHSAQNLLVMYPEQFGAEEDMPAPIDVLAHAVESKPTPGFLSLQHLRDILRRRRLRK